MAEAGLGFGVTIRSSVSRISRTRNCIQIRGHVQERTNQFLPATAHKADVQQQPAVRVSEAAKARRTEVRTGTCR